MSNTTITKLPDYRASYQDLTWYSDGVSSKYTINRNRWMFYRIVAAPSDVSFSAASLTVTFSQYVRDIDIRCLLYKDDPVVFSDYPPDPIATQTYTVTASGSHTYSFSGISAVGQSLYFQIDTLDTTYSIDEKIVDAASVTYALPSLSVGVSPSSLNTGSSVTLSFGGRFGEQVTAVFKYSSTTLASDSFDEDSVSVQCPASWFQTAGVGDSSMRVDVAVSDSLGRTASAYFTLVNPQGSTATPTAPKNTTVDGTETVSFAWSVSSDWGSQTRAELQWSADNANWTALATVTNSAKTWTAPAVSFPAGTIYWRVRVRNSYGIMGSWSSAVSFTVRYDAVSQVVPVNSPTSGMIDASESQRFEIALEASGQTYTPFTLASATFYSRAGTSGAWTSAAMAAGTTTAYIQFPANTFSGGTLQWYAAGTDNTGRTTETEVYTLSVMTASVTAVPVSPVNVVAGSAGPIAMRWTYSSYDGSAQAAAELQKSEDNLNWSALASVSGAATVWTAPTGTFGLGTAYWRVRSKNSANVWSDWSSAAMFKVIGAPAVSGVTPDGKPFCTVYWQVEGQRAYELEIDGEAIGPYFGPDVRSYTTKEPLANGLHTVRVRAQNKYGLWSEWAEGTADVSNMAFVPDFTLTALPVGPNVELLIEGAMIAPIITRQPQDYQSEVSTAFFRAYYKTWSDGQPASPDITWAWEYRTGPSAAWQRYTGQIVAETGAIAPTAAQANDGYQYRAVLRNYAGELRSDPATYYYRSPRGFASVLRQGEWKAPTGYFLIYRDGKQIGKTYENRFVDRFASGTHVYTAIQVLSGGYYKRAAATATATLRVDAPSIAPLSGGDWISLRLSEKQNREQSFTRSRAVSYVQYAGATWPDAEIGKAEELTGTGDVSFLYDDAAAAEAFEALIGRPVVYKTPGGVVIVGVLAARQRTDVRCYKSYTFTLRQMNWRDYTDES